MVDKPRIEKSSKYRQLAQYFPYFVLELQRNGVTLQLLWKTGLGKDLHLTAVFTVSIEIGSYITPRLTTIRQPIPETGRLEEYPG